MGWGFSRKRIRAQKEAELAALKAEAEKKAVKEILEDAKDGVLKDKNKEAAKKVAKKSKK